MDKNKSLSNTQDRLEHKQEELTMLSSLQNKFSSKEKGLDNCTKYLKGASILSSHQSDKYDIKNYSKEDFYNDYKVRVTGAYVLEEEIRTKDKEYLKSLLSNGFNIKNDEFVNHFLTLSVSRDDQGDEAKFNLFIPLKINGTSQVESCQYVSEVDQIKRSLRYICKSRGGAIDDSNSTCILSQTQCDVNNPISETDNSFNPTTLSCEKKRLERYNNLFIEVEGDQEIIGNLDINNQLNLERNNSKLCIDNRCDTFEEKNCKETSSGDFINKIVFNSSGVELSCEDEEDNRCEPDEYLAIPSGTTNSTGECKHQGFCGGELVGVGFNTRGSKASKGEMLRCEEKPLLSDIKCPEYYALTGIGKKLAPECELWLKEFRHIEYFVGKEIDMAWVIDNSGSMSGEQKALAQITDGFINSFKTTRNIAKLNLRQITSDGRLAEIHDIILLNKKDQIATLLRAKNSLESDINEYKKAIDLITPTNNNFTTSWCSEKGYLSKSEIQKAEEDNQTYSNTEATDNIISKCTNLVKSESKALSNQIDKIKIKMVEIDEDIDKINEGNDINIEEVAKSLTDNTVGTNGSGKERMFINALAVIQKTILRNSKNDLHIVLFSDEREQSGYSVQYWLDQIRKAKGPEGAIYVHSVINKLADNGSRFSGISRTTEGVYSQLTKDPNTMRKIMDNIGLSTVSIPIKANFCSYYEYEVYGKFAQNTPEGASTPGQVSDTYLKSVLGNSYATSLDKSKFLNCYNNLSGGNCDLSDSKSGFVLLKENVHYIRSKNNIKLLENSQKIETALVRALVYKDCDKLKSLGCSETCN